MMAVRLSHFVVICLALVDASSVWDVGKLYTDLIANSSYDKRFRPVIDQDNHVEINNSFELVSLHTFDDITGELAVSGVLESSWFDERMTWDPEDYNDTYSILIPKTDVWTPYLILKNPFDSMEIMGENSFNVRFLPDGSTIWLTGDLIRSACEVDILLYPFDIQTCSIQILALGYIETEVKLNNKGAKISSKYFKSNGEWELLDTALTTTSISQLSMLNMVIRLKRIPNFYIVNYILPATCLIFLSVFVFILPTESGEKVSYSITMLLSMTVFLTLVSGQITKTSQPISYLSQFLMITLIVSTKICILTILIVRLYHRDERIPISPWVRRMNTLLTRYNSQRQRRVQSVVNEEEDTTVAKQVSNDDCPLTWIDVSRTLDSLFFVLFTVFYLILILGFFVNLEQQSVKNQAPL